MSENIVADTRLAFVDISIFDSSSIRGGILVTDIDTRPYEFRVTTPVKPTSMQRMLYGATLAEYIYGELIGLPLVKAVKEVLNLIIVKNEYLLVMRPKLSIPTVYIKKGSEKIKVESEKTPTTQIVFKPHRKYSGDENQAKELLNELLQHQDLFEPFERLSSAMNEVHKLKVGEK